MITLKQNFALAGIVFVLCLVGAFITFSRTANANPDQILENKMGATSGVASSSPAWMTPGTATSTNSFDTQNDGALPAKSATLLVAFTPSTTASTLNIALEYSQDNNDWFGDNIPGVTSTSTQTALFGNPSKFVIPGATSTVVGGQQGAVNTIYRAITVPVPTRYVRAVMTLSSSTAISAGNGNGSLWSNFVAKKETR